MNWYHQLAKKGDAEAAIMATNLETMLNEMKLSPSPSQIASPEVKPFTSVKVSLEVSYSALTLVRELGRGWFGVVYRGLWQGNTVAIKQLLAKSLTEHALAEFIQEAHLMSQLRHPNVVTFYKICTEPNRYCIVMEYCEKGSLYDWLRTPEAMSWPVRLRISLGFARGLAFLHENKILHRDLKSANVLLDNTLTPKIADFGLAKVKHETGSQTMQGMKGTLNWNPPELVRGEVKFHSEKTDIYSFAMTLWEIASRKEPFENAVNQMLVFAWISQWQKETIPDDTPPPFAQLIGQCWDKRAELRPTAQAAVVLLESMEAVKSIAIGVGNAQPTLFRQGYRDNFSNASAALGNYRNNFSANP